MFWNIIPLPYKLLAATVCVVGVFLLGYREGINKGELIVQKAKNDIAELRISLKEEQANIKEKIVTQYIDKVRIVKEKEYVLQQAASNNVPSQYNLSNGWVYVHDKAVDTSVGIPDPSATADATPSDVKDNQALFTILTNYSACLQNTQQLIGLQNWVIETEKTINKNNKNHGTTENK